MIPLYQSDNPERSDYINWEELICSSSAHPGLVFDKFPDGWLLDNGKITLPDGENGAKEQFYTATIKNSQEHLKEGITHAINRQQDLVKKQKGCFFELKTDWRLITGLGNSHPYETGFTWHRTLGVPYLAGSSVKGMLRDWIVEWAEEGGEELANRLLGYQKTKYAGDYYNPVPVKFLTISAGQYFQFSIAPRTMNTSAEDLKQAENLLTEALENIGIGGKTAVGYGYFIKDEDSDYTGNQALISEIVSSYTSDDAKLYLSKNRNKAIEQIREKLGGFKQENWVEYIELIKQKFPDDIAEWKECTIRNNQMFKAYKAVAMSWMPNKDKYTDATED